LKFVALRYFNAAGATEHYGEHHDPETHLIGTLLQAPLGNVKEVPLYGDDYATPDGTAIRDYVHVLDLAQAHERALQYLRQGGASDFFNLGTGDGYSVLQVIECVRKITGREIKVRREPRRPGDPTKLVADASKAHRVLGWRRTQIGPGSDQSLRMGLASALSPRIPRSILSATALNSKARERAANPWLRNKLYHSRRGFP
jgi:UDP-glucose 4-epimerase